MGTSTAIDQGPTLRQKMTASISRLYPLLSGCGRVANSRLIRLAAGESGALVWGRLDGGEAILVPLDDYVGKAAYFVGDLDRKITRVIDGIVRPGDTVLDIGANLGIVTMRLASLVGSRGQVHAFEPNPRLIELLMRSVERNAALNVRIHGHALGAEECELDLAFPESNLGMATVGNENRAVPKEWDKVRVPVKTLSSVAREFDLGHVRLVKIDVEGYEEMVLRGALDWLSSSPPDAILFESNSPKTQQSCDPAMKILAENGYRFFGLPRRWFSPQLEPFDPKGGVIPTSHDFLAVQEAKSGEIMSGFRIQS
jgi:FkbM family methyltransferase